MLKYKIIFAVQLDPGDTAIPDPVDTFEICLNFFECLNNYLVIKKENKVSKMFLFYL